MRTSERSTGAVLVAAGVMLVPVMAIALAVLSGAGVWIVAVLGGVVLGFLVAVAGVGIVGVSRAAKRNEEELLTDGVTGLPSVDRLYMDLAPFLADRRQPRVELSLYLLDGLKRYNDAYGRACGDALLTWLGRKLRDAVGDGGTVYRMRGGEFAVLSPGDEDATTAVKRDALAALVDAGEGFVISASAGEVVVPEEAQTVSEALKLADHRAQAQRDAAHGEAAHQAPDDLIDLAEPPTSDFDIAELAVAVAQRLKVPAVQLDEIGAAANLRDIGNMAIPAAVLGRPGALPAEEWQFIRLHTLVGERLLAANFGMEEVARVVRSSHERWDGEGYPDGLRADAIPLGSRIVFVCSAFDDMTSSRAYRPALDPEAALEELQRGAGKQFDPEVVQAFRDELTAAESHDYAATNGDAPHARLSVLIADDDPASRFLLRRAVEAAGHDCITAETGGQAWQIYRSEAPDVVISDSRLPDIDGNELCRRIRREPRYTYFVMVNALGDLGRIRRGIGAGADDFLTKPIVREELDMRLMAAARATAMHADPQKRLAAG
jgi:two-component system, cell cycle response regulator